MFLRTLVRLSNADGTFVYGLVKLLWPGEYSAATLSTGAGADGAVVVSISLTHVGGRVVRARLQDARAFPSGAQRPLAGVLDAARTIVRLEGWRGLWAGFTINLLRALPATCVMFTVFEGTLGRVQAAGLLAA
jgi:hypothetical protein